MQIHHIAIQVFHLETAKKFYIDLLGFSEIRRQDHSIWLDAGGVILMLETCKQPAKSPKEWKSQFPGFYCLSFQILASERESFRKRFGKNNIPIEKESMYTLYFRDPDGNRLALSHYPNIA